MKLLHLADLHIGKMIAGFSMIPDQQYIFNQIYQTIENEKIDAVCISGDVYDRSIPSSEAVALLDEFLTALSEYRIPVFIIPGNHDHAQRLAFGCRMLKMSGIYIALSVEKMTLTDEYGPVNFYLLPFERPGAVRKADENEKAICTYEDAVRVRIRHMAVDPMERNVLVTHHFVAGRGAEPVTSDSEMMISAGGIERVGTDCFKDFDYTALGHIHRPQNVGSSAIRYAGSPLKYSFSEADRDKTLTVVTLLEKGNTEISEIPLVPLHDMRRIRGALDALVKPEVYTLADREDYLEVTLTDEMALYEPAKRLKSVYPNVMQINFERNRQRISESTAVAENMVRKTAEELFLDFYKEVTGEEPDDGRKALIEEVIREAREADT